MPGSVDLPRDPTELAELVSCVVPVGFVGLCCDATAYVAFADVVAEGVFADAHEVGFMRKSSRPLILVGL